MSYYTRTGDYGQTRIIGGHVYDKTHIRIDSYGKVDSLNALLGYTISQLQSGKLKHYVPELVQIQQDLFDCGNDLAQINHERDYHIQEDHWQKLEKMIDSYTEILPPLEKFILPGGSPEASLIHLCRTMTRDVERKIVTLFQIKDSSINNQEVLRYINRLSDYFFVLGRLINYELNCKDIHYYNSKPVFRNGILKNKRNTENKS